MSKRNSGFSLIELLMVVAIIIIGSTVAVVQMRQSMAVLDADKAANTVVSQIRYAREMAVNQRRNIDMAFIDPNRITVKRQDNNQVLVDVRLPSGYTFGLPSGVGDPTGGALPGQPVLLGAGTSGTFSGDGAFVDGGGIVISGTVYTIGSGNGSARAITLAGATGRIKEYYLQGPTWVDR